MSNNVDEMTERMLDDAGIGPGMRVLDIGCGPGAVSLMLSPRVGNQGHVFAVDRSPEMLELAREKVHETSVSNITFIEGEFDVTFPEHGTLDAAVGRRVLMYQSDATRAVTQLTRAIRSGGVIAFHEHDMIVIKDNRTSLPLHDQVRSWLREMLRCEGANLHMGFELHAALSAAGLAVERVRAEANVLTPTADYPVAAIIRSVLPRLLQHGIATEAEIGVETLDNRLASERREMAATYLWEMVFCGWARKH
ncbi:MAG: methyltransferase domain-containing protein [Chloroflexi bacterium AL-W]|nr:methyltransferase domain-containing protein [Chloroflexi bacterium AL-N1]NOK67804.1 methyltransferase domain-containing protein [Chloroflexi bacterium AL-N10]NOK75426.1 methyltransferase domain-containing protein [Chloroflexi bacterium AL-N5]NOK82214.1 methyltransferase domain-containing protein [Chloroflexi bacterium AL-W]NOK90059.1 methyltransferase domain-containing protein [Chloroflexi bacterium AL-N15]